MKKMYCFGVGIQANKGKPKSKRKAGVIAVELDDGTTIYCMECKTPGPSHTRYDPDNPIDKGRMSIWREIEGPIEVLIDGTWETIP